MSGVFKRIVKFTFYPIVLLRRYIIKHRNRYWSFHNPKKLANFYYKNVMGHNIDWNNPKDLNEKINWMKFYIDTSKWTELADKYRVRAYVESKGLADILVPLYGVWEKPEDIDFSSLPKSFVLKTNHACGTVILVEDKNQFNIPKAVDELRLWMGMKMGIETVEPHYLRITPLIMAEKMLARANEIVDYKLFTINGNVELVLVCSDRTIGVGCKLSLYDADWNFIPEKLSGAHLKDNVERLPKPKSFERMKECARILSEGCSQVRVDFYDINGKLYFGELTFTSQGGYMNYIAPEELLRLGKKIVLPKSN